MSSVWSDADIADVYDETYAAMFGPSVLGPVADVLAELAGGGPALEFAIGTGRVALPLSAGTRSRCSRNWLVRSQLHG